MQLPKQNCPSCRAELSTADSETTIPGNLAVCTYCGLLGVYDKNLMIVPLPTNISIEITPELSNVLKDIRKRAALRN